MKRILISLSLLLLTLCWQPIMAQQRRPIDNEHPLWLVHVDVWNQADPQKIIDLIPDDIKPYVCMNLSLSCAYDKDYNVYKMPRCAVRTWKTFFMPDTEDQFDFTRYDYVVDAIDTVKGKIALVMKARAAGTPIISALGAGNKLDPTAFEVADLAKTSVCPLARVMRRELGRRGVKHLKVVYSKEQPLTPLEDDEISCKYHCVCPPDSKRDCSIRRQVPGSVSFVPSVMGLIIAGEVVRDLVGIGR